MAELLPTLDTDLLRAFSAVAEMRNFTRAGELIGRTQSAVSMQIKRLEDQVQVQLFRRDGRAVELTENGQLLLGYARRILKLSDEAMTHFTAPGLSGVVRVGTPDDYAVSFLPTVLGAFARVYPAVWVEVVCDNSVQVMEMVAAGKLDVGLVSRGPMTPGGELVRSEPLHWVAAEGEPIYKETPLPLALWPEGCVCRHHGLSALDAVGRPWRVAYVSRSCSAIQGAVLSGIAVSMMEESTIPAGIRRLAAADGLPELPDVEITIHRRPGKLPDAAERLVQYFRERLADDQPLRMPAA